MEVDQLAGGASYLYSDSNDKWERGGARHLSLTPCINEKGSLKIVNNTIMKTDRNLDFDLNFTKITDRIKVGAYLWDER